VRLPDGHGPLSAAVVHALRTGTYDALPGADAVVADDVLTERDLLADDDAQLALWVLFELHYRGFDDAPAAAEWQPELIGLRRCLEDRLLEQLRTEVVAPVSDEPVTARVRDVVDGDDGPSLSRYVQTKADLHHFIEFVVHRSTYQLKEADPHTWAVPRLSGAAKAALVEIQVDEYGAGDADRMHSELFRTLLRSLDLDDGYGAYVPSVPGITLAVSNVMSLFGLRRELRGALVGHLTAYEMTSSAPCRRYAKALRRLGGDDAACAFYDVHVTADALHEQLALHDLCGGLVAAEPELADDVVFGAAACLYVERRFAEHVLHAWQHGRSSLREPVERAGAVRLEAVG
jgi:hypothetical protein